VENKIEITQHVFKMHSKSLLPNIQNEFLGAFFFFSCNYICKNRSLKS